MRASYKAAGVISAAALLLGAGATSVSAQTAETISCIDKVDSGRTFLGKPWVRIKNNCYWTYKVKVVWNFAPDSVCTNLSPGETFRDEAVYSAVYDKTVTC
ncbi:hypothetical protein ABZ897_56935 [Nonomuraea sp. NPDC046802]|uniref:hypothetical protein n=1 Tax=Nonomuraea sp. NPDC046802 TaxID=3154919 RepID=UPI0033D8910E